MGLIKILVLGGQANAEIIATVGREVTYPLQNLLHTPLPPLVRPGGTHVGNNKALCAPQLGPPFTVASRGSYDRLISLLYRNNERRSIVSEGLNILPKKKSGSDGKSEEWMKERKNIFKDVVKPIAMPAMAQRRLNLSMRWMW